MNLNDPPFEPLDAQLMLLAAGELPVGEAASLRNRLDQDPALAARYETVVAEMRHVEQQLAVTDQIQPVSQAAQRAVEREASRSVAAWINRDTGPQPQVIAPSRLESAVWYYARWPLAAAAAIVVGLIVLPPLLDKSDEGGMRADRPIQQGGGVSDGSDVERGNDDTARRLPGGADLLAMGSDPMYNGFRESAGNSDSGELLAQLFEAPGQWDVDGDGEHALDLGPDLRDELATLQALGDTWTDDGY